MLVLLALYGLVLVPAWAGQDPAAPGADAAAPLLTLDEAVSLALANNRLVKNSVLEAQKSDFQIETMRTKRLPQFNVAVLEAETFQPLDLTFKAGAFGTFPLIGPVPSILTNIRTPARLDSFALGTAIEPLTQQYKIGLGIRATALGRDVAREDVRAEREKIANQVRSAYFDLFATQTALDAAREAVTTLEEVKRVAAQYEAQQAILKADVYQVEARLAKQRYQLLLAENGIASQREHLNELLGRDIATVFRVAPLPEPDAADLTLERARQNARDNRPEIRQARLRRQQAEYDRRISKAGYIPDLSLAVGYLGMRTIDAFPSNGGAAGLLLTWEPFDWGRRRNELAEKSRTVSEAANGVEETEAQIAVEVGVEYRKWREAALYLTVTRTAQEAAVEALRVANNKFKEQAAMVKDVLQAAAENADAQYQYQQSLARYWSAFSDLRKAMGEE
jgi:outer membrane protein TolC